MRVQAYTPSLSFHEFGWLVGVGRAKAMLPEPFSNPYKLNPYFFYLLYMVLMMLYLKVVVNLFYSNITI